ncbi:MAG: hypothetical protein H7318_09965 [Oligoflexus sp.]|nr:hypothetical protein [Oligoflexus sp.]
MKTVQFLTAALTFVSLNSALQAQPKTTPAREKARCESNVDLCDSVARDDLNNCNAAQQSSCSNNYMEDINQCTNDYTDCLDGIASIKGTHAGLEAVLSGGSSAVFSAK